MNTANRQTNRDLYSHSVMTDTFQVPRVNKFGYCILLSDHLVQHHLRSMSSNFLVSQRSYSGNVLEWSRNVHNSSSFLALHINCIDYNCKLAVEHSLFLDTTELPDVVQTDMRTELPVEHRLKFQSIRLAVLRVVSPRPAWFSCLSIRQLFVSSALSTFLW